jgi:hypothetical protein
MPRRLSRLLAVLQPVASSVAFLVGCLALTTLTWTLAIAQVSHSKVAFANLNHFDGAKGTAGDSSDTLQFLTPVNYLTNGAGSQFVASADLNGDGFPDAIVGNAWSQNVTIFIGRGDGFFRRSVI